MIVDSYPSWVLTEEDGGDSFVLSVWGLRSVLQCLMTDEDVLVVDSSTTIGQLAAQIDGLDYVSELLLDVTDVDRD